MKDHSLLSHSERVEGESPLWQDSDDEEPTRAGLVTFHDVKRPFGKSGSKLDFQHKVEDNVGLVTDDNSQALRAGERAREGYEDGTAGPLGQIARRASISMDPIGRVMETSRGTFFLAAEWISEIGKVRIELFKILPSGEWEPYKSLELHPSDFR